MTDTLSIAIVSDVVCPWCVIGYKRLEQAILALNMQDTVTISWEPFALNPHVPAEGLDTKENMARKYGMTPADSDRFQQQMKTLGAELGFTFDYFDGMKTYDTRDAHILLECAKEYGKQTELKMRLFEAYFSEHKNITDRHVLKELVQQVGLNTEELMIQLDSEAVYKQVQERKTLWRTRGVTAVPTVFVNEATELTGAQSIATYKEVLTEQSS